ncbi:MAG TPA: pyridoxal-phosphate dependent enzyme [Kineosporiaceae bacterium]|nr:pyridoxal-phosphate dependent enzyme [Kineosporiaceae bacterium]
MPDLSLRLPSPLVELDDERFARHGVRVYLKRDDLIHPELPGNKWRKLRLNLLAAREQGHSRLLTFGGAYSNHLSATAAAGYHFGFDTVGVVRGEEHLPLNDTLSAAVGHGMELTYLDRTTYRRKLDPEVVDDLRQRFGPCYLLPEGGSNALAALGCTDVPAEIEVDFDVICCACGTGGTLAGVAAGLRPGQRAIGFSALKGGQFLVNDVNRLQTEAFGVPAGNWSIEMDFHFGGFAKRTDELAVFIADFLDRHGFRPDWVYVAKMLYGLLSLTERGRFAPGTTVVALITG